MSFKRAQKQVSATSQPSPSTRSISTGISSLDDILGGGLPPFTSLVISAPNVHTEYSDLVAKYFVAQGLFSRSQRLCVVGDEEWVRSCMWTLPGTVADETDKEENESHEKIKIAWRYEGMKRFQTTTSTTAASTVDAPAPFDLTARIPAEVVSESLREGRLCLIPIDNPHNVLQHISAFLSQESRRSSQTRLCVPGFASPWWGDVGPRVVLRFLFDLRALVRRHDSTFSCCTLGAEYSRDDSGWQQKIGWFADAAISMDAFAGNSTLTAAFPTHHGLLRVHTLPAPTSLVPASDRLSVLRGAMNGTGENNLGFKCTRRKLVFETVHLDVEGGVGERRTTEKPVTAIRPDVQNTGAASPRVAVELQVESAVEIQLLEERKPPKKKTIKRVGFQSDRPDVYDF